MNLFDGDILLGPGSRFLVRDTSGQDLLALLYTPVDPNGILDEPIGSIASGPAGSFVSTGAYAWSVLGGGSSQERVLVWGLAVPWSTIDAALDAVGRKAIVLVEGDLTGAARLMTRSSTDPDGLTDLSGVFFMAWWPGSDTLSAPPPSGALVDWDATPGLEFQLGRGGVLQSKDILWRYGARIGSAAGFMGRIYVDLDGGGIAPQPGYTGDVVRIGKAGVDSLIKLRNGAVIGDGGLVDAMFIVTPSAAAPPFALTVGAVSAASIQARAFSTPAANPFAPYPVPVIYDASVRYDPSTAHVNASAPLPMLLDTAQRVIYDPSLVNLLAATDLQSAVDEIASVVLPTWADAIVSVSTPVPGTMQVPANVFDRSLVVPADVLEAGDVLEIVAGGEYTVVANPGADAAGIALLLGSFGAMNGNFGPIPQAGSQFVMKARITISSPGAPGTILIFQENDFATQLSGILQYSPQQTGPHALDTSIPNSIEVRGYWGVGSPAGNEMVLRTLTANLIKKVP